MTSVRERSNWPSAQPTLSDEVITIRPWHSDDAAWVFDACQDPDIQRWTRVPAPYALSDAQGFVGELAPSHWQNERGAPFAVTDSATGAGLGSVGLIVHDLVSGVAEAGYWTTPAARARGVTTAALLLLTDFAFRDLGLVRLELLVEVENAKSKAVAERAGYHCEGVLTKKVWKHGAHRDVALFARTV